MSWQRTHKIVPQALISAIYGFGDILAGTILWMYFPSDVGWAAILYPPLMGARGAIAGSIVGRLTSSLNIGIVEPNWSRGNKKLVSLESIAGIFLGEAISISDARVLLIYPAMLTELGDASSIIGSILTTRLFLGLLRRKIPIIDVMPEVTGVFAVFLGFFSLMGGILWLYGGNPLVSILTFLIAFPIMLLITSSVVILTSKRFDPDNFTIPLATSSADLVTTATVAAVLILLGS
ncbi:MAG: magnesium transporter [Candidatus Korarchaeota archaeon]|nr:magnesium transporter [Candidatus Korarchaeota archaeon]